MFKEDNFVIEVKMGKGKPIEECLKDWHTVVERETRESTRNVMSFTDPAIGRLKEWIENEFKVKLSGNIYPTKMVLPGDFFPDLDFKVEIIFPKPPKGQMSFNFGEKK